MVFLVEKKMKRERKKEKRRGGRATKIDRYSKGKIDR